ncbi:MAG TPA: dienelactone hydrolase family protein [Stellaceae bacterium]|jgi:dienelactone hydrolase|nr:dienelactone hydrolase family protein [Stellaceae bacterium]
MSVETIRYAVGAESFASELIYDEAKPGKRPLLLVAPNWFGVTPDWTNRTRALAGERYVAFLVDVYGEGKRPQDRLAAAAAANAQRANPAEWRRRVAAALDHAVREGERRGIADTSKRAAIGFCFGGGCVFELARMGGDIQAAVSIHGDLIGAMPAAPKQIKAAMLAIHGSEDPIAPKSRRDAFEAEMQYCGAKWQMLLLGGLYHSFTDFGVNVPPEAQYNENAARQAYAWSYNFIENAFAGTL